MVRIAKAVAPTTIIVEVEGGVAGGHHSWESLDDLLLNTYADVRACQNLVLVAGGGIGTPGTRRDYISGQWARAYDMPDMPVDGVLVGTAAMTAKEAHTSPQVKKMLVETPGHHRLHPGPGPVCAPRREVGAVRQGVGRRDLRSEPSACRHLRAGELSARCGRLQVRVMKHPEELTPAATRSSRP